MSTGSASWANDRESPSHSTITQIAGDHGLQIGQVHGNVYNYYGSEAAKSESTLVVDISRSQLRSTLCARLENVSRHYTHLESQEVTIGVNGPTTKNGEGPKPLLNEINQHARLVVLGAPGTGKTASLQFIAYSYANQEKTEGDEQPDPVCLLIDLARYRQWPGLSGMDCVAALIGEILQVWGGCEDLPSLPRIRQFLTQTRALILFDGLNEVSSDIRAYCLKGILDFALRYPDNGIILSSRPYQFPSLEGWRTIAICALSETSIQQFLTGYTTSALASSIYESASRIGSGLLEVPLFLKMVVDLCQADRPPGPEAVGSKAKLVAQYIALLMSSTNQGRPSQNADSVEVPILQLLARHLQQTGQSIPIEQIPTIASAWPKPYSEIERTGRAIESACEHGILILDGRHLKFWHQVLQEHFFSWHTSAELNWSSGGTKLVPEWLRELIRQRSNEEALAQITAFMGEEDIFLLMREAAGVNLNLALRWTEDLIAENRELRSVDHCFKCLNQLTYRLLRYGWIIDFQRFLWRRKVLIFQLILGVFWMFLVPVHLVAALLRLAVQRRFDLGVATLVAAGRVARSSVVSSRVSEAFLELERVKVSADPVRRFRRDQTANREVTRDDVGSILGFSETLYHRLDYLELVDDEAIVDLLAVIIRWQNVYSIKALKITRSRLKRFPAERRKMLPILRHLYNNKDATSAIRGKTRGALLAAGERVSLVDDLRGRLMKRYWEYLRVVLFMLLALFFLGVGFAIIGEQTARNRAVTLGISSVVAYLVYRDANRIGIVRVQGCNRWDALGPAHYAAAAFVLWIITVPAYILIRGTARRNSINWDRVAN